MKSYAYQARSRDGKIVQGMIVAESAEGAAKELIARGLFPSRVKGTEKGRGIVLPTWDALRARYEWRNGRAYEMFFSRQLAAMLSAGLPLGSALQALRAEGSNSYQKMVRKLIEEVSSGHPLFEGVRKFPYVFSPLSVRLIKAGEMTGNLEILLARLADFLEKRYASEEKMKAVMLYPMILLCVALGVGGFLLLVVLPTFQLLFAGLSLELPFPTRILLAVGDFIMEYGVLAAIGVAIGAFALVGIYLRPSIQRRVDAGLFSIPLWGKARAYTAWMQVLGTQAVLLSSGIRLDESIRMTLGLARNAAMDELLENSRQAVLRGESLAREWARAKFFPPLLAELIYVGERAGCLDEMLARAADFCQLEGEMKAKRMEALAEPIVLLVIGGIVALFALAIVLPWVDTLSAI